MTAESPLIWTVQLDERLKITFIPNLTDFVDQPLAKPVGLPMIFTNLIKQLRSSHSSSFMRARMLVH